MVSTAAVLSAVLVAVFIVTDVTGQVPTCTTTNGVCVNGICLANTLACQCTAGYVLNTTVSLAVCYDFNECGNNDICGYTRSYYGNLPTGVCKNTVGSYYCVCYQGFQRLGGICQYIPQRYPQRYNYQYYNPYYMMRFYDDK